MRDSQNGQNGENGNMASSPNSNGVITGGRSTPSYSGSDKSRHFELTDKHKFVIAFLIVLVIVIVLVSVLYCGKGNKSAPET